MSTSTISHFTKKQSRGREEVMEEEKLSKEIKEFLPSLPREKGWRTPYIYLFQGFWCPPPNIQAITNFQKHFQAKDNDIVITSSPKSGTTWLKALTFAIVNRHRFVPSRNHPLLSSNPHELVPFFEFHIYSNNQIPDLSNRLEPRLFGTHIPFSSLPDSMKKSNCRIIYICRNPFDNFISFWHYSNKLKSGETPPLTLYEAFDLYCKGIFEYGPFWNHMLGFWKESLEKPNKIMFLQYEDLKQDTNFHLKSLAKFLDCPFSLEEERSGVIEDIINMCSFEKMKELEVNKYGSVTGISGTNVVNNSFFRKGEVGDWANYFSPQMVEKLSEVMEEKLGGSGLSFKCTLDASVTNK